MLRLYHFDKYYYIYLKFTVGKIILMHSNWNFLLGPTNCEYIQYCDSNVEFSLLLHVNFWSYRSYSSLPIIFGSISSLLFLIRYWYKRDNYMGSNREKNKQSNSAPILFLSIASQSSQGYELDLCVDIPVWICYSRRKYYLCPNIQNNFWCPALLYCFPFSYRSCYSKDYRALHLSFIFCIGFVHWFTASFLYCSPYSYRSPN